MLAVLPAQAGVSRTASATCTTATGPPRAGGGQPTSAGRGPDDVPSSPRRRGSAGGRGARPEHLGVLPAQAGVSRPGRRTGTGTSSPPRAGGGQPSETFCRSASEKSSPRRRGSAAVRLDADALHAVLPAQAGVSRPRPPGRGLRCGPPRAGGGQPTEAMASGLSARSSPRRRGSAAGQRCTPQQGWVLPAQAGVSRRRQAAHRGPGRPPRAGGGQPAAQAWCRTVRPSSPRRRGSADGPDWMRTINPVLPAQAGVSRGWTCSRPPGTGPPRAGGGQPEAARD